MKNKENLYSMQTLSLFTYFIMLSCTAYFVFPSYMEENPLLVYLLGVIFCGIIFGILLYVSLRKTMHFRWIMGITIVFSILLPFFYYATYEKNHMLLLSVSIFLSFYFLIPSDKKETV